MRKIFKSIIVIVMALVMAISSLVVVAAEVTETAENDTNATTITTNDDGTKAYQLVWKYKSSGGHMYKRRWNMTLGQWYDPDWILVY